jgi:ABC-type dipeptide/oligopeptide/nickel transport system permease component
MSQFCHFVATRFLLAIVTLLIVTFIVYSLMELSPLKVKNPWNKGNLRPEADPG